MRYYWYVLDAESNQKHIGRNKQAAYAYYWNNGGAKSGLHLYSSVDPPLEKEKGFSQADFLKAIRYGAVRFLYVSSPKEVEAGFAPSFHFKAKLDSVGVQVMIRKEKSKKWEYRPRSMFSDDWCSHIEYDPL